MGFGVTIELAFHVETDDIVVADVAAQEIVRKVAEKLDCTVKLLDVFRDE